MQHVRSIASALGFLLSSCAETGSSSRQFDLDLCDLTSDRTVISIQDVEVVGIGARENLRFDSMLPSGAVSTSYVPSTPIEVRVNRVLRGRSETTFFLGDSVSLNGSSTYGNVAVGARGIFFVRETGGHKLAIQDGFFTAHGDGVVRNPYAYADGIPLATLEAAVAETEPGSPCPHDTLVPRYDSSSSP